MATGAEQAGGFPVDPLHQFVVQKYIPLNIGGLDASFTNASLWMVLTVVAITLFTTLGMGKGSMVPGRMQSVVEGFYTFLADMVRDNAGHDAMRFFPFIFSLFMFIFFANMLGMLPIAFTVTSHIVVTFALAMLVFLTVTLYGLWRNGLGFFRLFLPSGVPVALAPIIIPIEIVSYLSRPVSHSVRLFAVMLAGHITLKVFGGFVTMLLGAGAYAALAPLPLAGVMAILPGACLILALPTRCLRAGRPPRPPAAGRAPRPCAGRRRRRCGTANPASGSPDGCR